MTTTEKRHVLSGKAMIAYLKISQWSGHKLDREVTDEVNDMKNAKADSARVNKRLLPKDALAEVRSIADAIRAEFNKRTLPWLSDGARVMPSSKWKETASWMRSEQDKFDAAVDKFVAAYPTYLQRAANDLGDMFRATDYPTPKEVGKRFSIEVSLMPIPSGDDFRLDLAGEEMEELRLEVERSVERATTEAMKDVYGRVAEVTERMVERLSKFKPAKKKGERTEGTFRDTLVTNVRDLVAILPSLNIVDDDRLRDITRRLDALSQTSPQQLRDNPKARESTRDEAERILSLVSGWAA